MEEEVDKMSLPGSNWWTPITGKVGNLSIGLNLLDEWIFTTRSIITEE